MHTILPSPDDVIAITMSGKITGADLDAAMERLDRAIAAADPASSKAPSSAVEGPHQI
jgi:hypothetical protein